MRWITPMSPKYIRWEERWHDWFAWYPVDLCDGSGQTVWLEWVKRKGTEENYKRLIGDTWYQQTRWNWEYVSKD